MKTTFLTSRTSQLEIEKYGKIFQNMTRQPHSDEGERCLGRFKVTAAAHFDIGLNSICRVRKK